MSVSLFLYQKLLLIILGLTFTYLNMIFFMVCPRDFSASGISIQSIPTLCTPVNCIEWKVWYTKKCRQCWSLIFLHSKSENYNNWWGDNKLTINFPLIEVSQGIFWYVRLNQLSCQLALCGKIMNIYGNLRGNISNFTREWYNIQLKKYQVS